MKLELVNFKQAKKLKRLGFDWHCHGYYNDPDDLITNGQLHNHNYDVHDMDKISAPTIALALKWMRDVKKINSHVVYNKRGEKIMNPYYYVFQLRMENYFLHCLNYDFE